MSIGLDAVADTAVRTEDLRRFFDETRAVDGVDRARARRAEVVRARAPTHLALPAPAGRVGLERPPLVAADVVTDVTPEPVLAGAGDQLR